MQKFQHPTLDGVYAESTRVEEHKKAGWVPVEEPKSEANKNQSPQKRDDK
jgi:hypothetical protein